MTTVQRIVALLEEGFTAHEVAETTGRSLADVYEIMAVNHISEEE